MSIRPHTATADAAAIEDLRRRLRAARWPEAETVDDWSQGVPLAYCQELADYWLHEYDWQRCIDWFNTQPGHIADVAVDDTAQAVHFLHVRSDHDDAQPLLITHGWPGAVLEFRHVIDALVRPEKHGGAPEDAFHLVLPTLPGYGFSGKPRAAGTTVERIADQWCALMDMLGYGQFYAQGGDWGAPITCAMAQRQPQRCQAIHLNLIIAPPDPETLDNPAEDEQRALQAQQYYAQWDSAYAVQQSTRPQTLGYALADSAVGQLAWIVEKFWAWTDCERDGVRHPENAVSRDDMLDIVSLYWFTNSATSSARLYWESYRAVDLESITVPMGASRFPRDILTASERWARQRFTNLVYWNALDRGGHFAALEQPQLFVDELRRWRGAVQAAIA